MKRLLTLAIVVVTTALAPACSKPAAPVAAEGEHHEGGHEEREKAEGAEAHEHGTDRETVDADGVVRRGRPLSADKELLTVAVAASKAKDLEGKSVKVKGTVESVCQPQGCWFVIQGDTPDQKIRVSSKGHDVFVPKSAAGLHAVVEGELKVKTLTKDVAEHFESERELKPGEQHKVITGEVQELSIAVEALEMTKG